MKEKDVVGTGGLDPMDEVLLWGQGGCGAPHAERKIGTSYQQSVLDCLRAENLNQPQECSEKMDESLRPENPQ